MYYVAVKGLWGAAFRMPLLGAVPHQVAFDVDGFVAFSPDDRQLAHLRHDGEHARTLLLVARTATVRVNAHWPTRQRDALDTPTGPVDQDGRRMVVSSRYPPVLSAVDDGTSLGSR